MLAARPASQLLTLLLIRVIIQQHQTIRTKNHCQRAYDVATIQGPDSLSRGDINNQVRG